MVIKQKPSKVKTHIGLKHMHWNNKEKKNKQYIASCPQNSRVKKFLKIR